MTDIIEVSEQGPTGPTSYTTTTANFIQPGVDANVHVSVKSTAWMAIGQPVFVTVGGSYTVVSITGAASVLLQNTGGLENAAPTDLVPSGAQVTAAGATGPVGDQGDPGVNSFTTASSFVQPAPAGMVTVAVGASAWASVGQTIFIVGGGYYLVTAVPDATDITIQNTGIAGNASPGSPIANGANVCPAGPIGATGSTGASGAGPSGSTGISAGTGSLVSAGDTVSYNLPCAVNDRSYFFRLTALIRSTAAGGPVLTDDTWVSIMCVLAKNVSGTVTVIDSWYEGTPRGDASMGVGGGGGGACGLAVDSVSGTNVICVVTGNGNNGVNPLNVRLMADSWLSI